MPNKKSTILVLDANQRSALAVVRSLGRHTYLRVITADEAPTALSGSSRYSAQYFQHPSAAHEPEIFFTWLTEIIQSEKIDWVFPTTEISSRTVLQLNNQLGICRIPFASYETVLALADKWSLVLLAEKCGVAYPESRHFNSSAEIDERQVTQYPVVIKPCLSRIRTPSGWLNTTVHVANDVLQLKLLLEKPYLRNYPFILQEFIPGHGAGIFALYDHGKPVTFFAHKRLREKPPAGGVSTLSESAPLDPQMHGMAKKLLDAAEWHGVAMIEFRVDPAGKAYLMEVNTRFWGSLQLAIDAGVDFPHLLYRVCNEENPQIVDKYSTGRRLRWLLGDLDNLLLTVRPRSGYSVFQKLRAVVRFFIPHPFSTRHEINRFDDLAPAWFELKQYIKNLLN
ncbi:MAG: hypothetical protein JWM78_3172 [Verrucomicrobiaceae bacterium]|nr:hypothetical protein [Verrucomicrobiaceae bacterium]